MPTPDLDELTVQRRRTLLIAGVLSAVVLLIGVGVALAVLAHRPATTKPPITPAEETSETAESSEEPTAAFVATSSATPTPTASTSPTASSVPTTTGQIVRSARIAYRLGGQIWVSGEDGSNAKAVYTSGVDRPFALSPDGRTLVAASSATTYVLVDTASLAQFPVAGPIDLPAWAPDSSWLAYTARTTAGGYQVRRVNRTGTADATVTAGARPQIAPDGRRVAFTASLDPSSTAELRVYDTVTKKRRAVPNGKGAQTFAWASGGTLYFARDRIGAVPGWIGVTDKGLTKTTVLASLPVADPPASPGMLYPSPDASKVLFAMVGDDGHSRLHIADRDAKKITPISTRYDAYPRSWLLDGSAVLYIEGNGVQREATSLYQIRPNGTKRTLVVKGAGL